MFLINRLTRLFRQRDREIPYSEQPIPDYTQIEQLYQHLADRHAYNRRLRHGPTNINYLNLKNSQRVMEFVGNDARNLHVPSNKALTVEVTLVHPTYGTYEVTFSYRTGEQFNPATEQSKIAGLGGKQFPAGVDKSDFVRESIVTKNYYLRSYRPLSAVG